MSDIVAVALITAVPGTLTVVLSVYNSLRMSAIERHNRLTRITMEKLEKNTNNKMDQLLKVTGELEFAKGAKAEADKKEK